MIRRTQAAVIAAALGLASLQATAQVSPDNFMGGRTSDLAALCAAGPSDPQAIAAINACHGFIMATAQFHYELTSHQGILAPFYCLPRPPPNLRDATAGFVAWARANPQFADTAAVEGVVRYATATYPCPDAPRRGAARR